MPSGEVVFRLNVLMSMASQDNSFIILYNTFDLIHPKIKLTFTEDLRE